MKISELIEQLKNYNPDDKIIIAFWDKDCVSEWFDTPLDNQVWNQVVNSYDDSEWGWHDIAADTIIDLVNEKVNE